MASEDARAIPCARTSGRETSEDQLLGKGPGEGRTKRGSAEVLGTGDNENLGSRSLIGCGAIVRCELGAGGGACQPVDDDALGC